jgi:hypothetical protein
MMRKVFICSALRGDIRANITKAAEYCRWTMITHGVLPIAPHVYFTRFLDEDSPTERELGISTGLELLRDCDALWVFGDRVTEGMTREINMARSLGIAVRYMDGREINLNEKWRNPYEISY